MDNRKKELKQQVEEHVSQFAVGDVITFSIWDGDVEIHLEGKILSIEGNHAKVEHKYGVCKTWLAISTKVNNED